MTIRWPEGSEPAAADVPIRQRHNPPAPSGDVDPSHLDLRQGDSRPAGLICAVDSLGTPQTGYSLSTRSVTTIAAIRLPAAAHAEQHRQTTTPTASARPPRGPATTTPASSQHAKPPPTASPASKPTPTKPTLTPKPSLGRLDAELPSGPG